MKNVLNIATSISFATFPLCCKKTNLKGKKNTVNFVSVGDALTVGSLLFIFLINAQVCCLLHFPNDRNLKS